MTYRYVLGVGLLCLHSGASLAIASAEEVARLGQELTRFGAEVAGNAEGTIPPYTGGLPRAGDLSGAYPTNPSIEADKPLYVITAANMEQYAEQLTVGHKAMLQRFPNTYRMPVYPTRRTVSYPEHILEATVENARRTELPSVDQLHNAVHGFPFPLAKSGAEVIWNHKLRWRGHAGRRYNNQAIVQSDGSYQISKLIEEVEFLYTNQDFNGRSEDLLAYYMSEVIAPPRSAGQLLLVHETSDQTAQIRNAWIYNPGLRRPRRAPNAGYDNPFEGSDGNQLNDQVDMYNGAMDRYSWQLLGKKEMIVPYNAYKISSPEVSYDQIIDPGHIDQSLARYELRRVWVVEAELLERASHIFGRRTFYVEEDSWAINSVDCYDRRGELYKFQESQQVFMQNAQVVGGTPEIIYDFYSGRYFLTALANEDKPNDFSVRFDSRHFDARTLRDKARR